MYDKSEMNQLVQELEHAQEIQMPYGDNEGDPLNHPHVYSELSPEDQGVIDAIEELSLRVLKHPDGTPNNHAIQELRRRGFPAYLGPNQYDPMLLDGKVDAGENWIDLSDNAFQSNDVD